MRCAGAAPAYDARRAVVADELKGGLCCALVLRPLNRDDTCEGQDERVSVHGVDRREETVKRARALGLFSDEAQLDNL